MTRILAITNHKGGVGKTTTSINLGAALVKNGRKVLLIDLDPQANLTTSLGITDRVGKTIYEALKNQVHIFGTIVQVKEGMAVIPGCMELSNAEVELSTVAGREYLLSEMLEPIKMNYDIIILDCPPSLGILTMNALGAATHMLITMQSEYLAMQGFQKLEEVLGMIKKRINPGLEVLGIVLTLYDHRKKLHKEIFQQVQDTFSYKIFETKIRDNITLAEAPKAGKDIFAYDANCHGAKDYWQLALELENLLATP